MLRKKKSKKNAEARDVSIRERMEHSDADGPTRNGHGTSDYDEELHDEELHDEGQDDREFSEELRDLLDEETGEIQDGERAFDVAGNGEARPATADEVADTVNTIWRQRLEDDPEGALGDLRARVNQLGYRLAYAGRTHLAPVTKRTYYIVHPDIRERIDVFHNGDADLTLLDVCLWTELAFKTWTNP